MSYIGANVDVVECGKVEICNQARVVGVLIA